MGYFVRFAPLYYVIWTLTVDLPHYRSPRDGSNKGSLGGDTETPRSRLYKRFTDSLNIPF